MEGEGFEPSKAKPPGLQPGPFGHSGIPPCHIPASLDADLNELMQLCASTTLRAGDRTRTNNQLLTKQPLYQLSYASDLPVGGVRFVGITPASVNRFSCL